MTTEGTVNSANSSAKQYMFQWSPHSSAAEEAIEAIVAINTNLALIGQATANARRTPNGCCLTVSYRAATAKPTPPPISHRRRHHSAAKALKVNVAISMSPARFGHATMSARKIPNGCCPIANSHAASATPIQSPLRHHHRIHVSIRDSQESESGLI
ncbi:hypothetical protein ANCCAN_20331 [Ancylostoma caninum]|uniref:Uncharacterized protein n=1 Tax=Ancylostoma caninum TaxID=29170 RepID=A0A368FNM5_ANCCA|nr:hypothetical protein ANCCAN_20331 [Ancylostoma caninum]